MPLPAQEEHSFDDDHLSSPLAATRSGAQVAERADLPRAPQRSVLVAPRRAASIVWPDNTLLRAIQRVALHLLAAPIPPKTKTFRTHIVVCLEPRAKKAPFRCSAGRGDGHTAPFV
jgi:hypothetical protein